MTVPFTRKGLTDALSRPGVRLRGWRRLPLPSKAAVCVLAVIALTALFAPLLSPDDPLDQQPLVDDTGHPSARHWMGQDSLGRDILSRLMYGARWSLAIGVGATLLALVAGALLGAIAATSRKEADETLMRCLDVVMAFPGIALAAVLVAVFGGGITVLICAIAFLFTPSVARVVRANVLDQYGEDYVTAERVIGARTPHIVLRHVAINCAAPILVFCTVQVAEAIVFEASLSFIGAGVRPPAPSWGGVLADGKNLVLTGGWWATVFPGLLMLVTVLALNVLSEGVSDAWAAPAAREVEARAEDPVAARVENPVGAPAEDPVGAGTEGPVEAARIENPVAASIEDPAAASIEHPMEARTEGPVEAARTDGPVEARTGDPVKARTEEPVEAPEPGSGEVLPLPGLAAAARRLRSRARRPLPPGRQPVLAVENLAIGFENRHHGVDIVDGISFEVRPGEVVGLVGESGCGKSLTALAIMGLAPKDARVRGQVRFRQRELLAEPMRVRRRLLGHEMAMIYQDALSSLNPAMTIRAQLKQVVRRGGRRSPAELLGLVGLEPDRTLRSYPHELSGGQRQRVLIAMALSRDPRLIVADEPTTALDVTVQAQVMELLLRLREELGFSLILVSHDLALVAAVTDRVVVMYGGQIVESGVTADLVEAPAHPYTRGLLGSVLSLESSQERMTQIKGVVPAPADFPPGCRFTDRCPSAGARCRTTAPVLAGPHTHTVACHHPAVDLVGAESSEPVT
ncbi:peptide/nickel transport system permease protein [Streptomyces sp. LBL]|uniref:dipeptide/oligopeptide/nickel ABC transporter permease/ATP-binding protein n=1 Tax=Streptomyces sp. LBL TaxID=2940562 RepID=UPI00247449E5|nr:dipeptide/oligopeptide/nickel ABC transporter permease/ATP-binding protein [Streptomyces sp. LBL]MDH6627652.1 peptide/nickel transport system permease protein [Streptomyces sp. LBL]